MSLLFARFSSYVAKTLAVPVLMLSAGLAQAADRDQVEAFLKVTGFDVAIESLGMGARSAPEMLGLSANDFGQAWTSLSDEVFKADEMLAEATDMLEATLEADLLAHAAGFYASDLGQRLVEVENASQLTDDEARRADGEAILAELRSNNDPRLPLYARMSEAIDPDNTSVRAVQELQIRFLTAAAGAGVIQLRMDEADMRAAMKEEEEALKGRLIESGIRSSAYTYQDFSLDDILAYTEALEHEDMQLVYQLLNAVQWQVMIGRYEQLAWRMRELTPAQDL